LISDSDPELLRQLEKWHSVTAIILCDSGSVYRNRLGIISFPFNIIVGDSLVIRDLIAGYIRSEEFEEIVGKRR